MHKCTSSILIGHLYTYFGHLTALTMFYNISKFLISNKNLKSHSHLTYIFEPLFCIRWKVKCFSTYILFPGDSFCWRKSINCAFKVNIIPFSNIHSIQFGTQFHTDLRRVWKWMKLVILWPDQYSMVLLKYNTTRYTKLIVQVCREQPVHYFTILTLANTSFFFRK